MQKLKKFARATVFVCLATWACVVFLVFAKPVLVHLNQNQIGEPENRMCSLVDVLFFPSHDEFIKTDWDIAISAPLIGIFPALVVAFILDIFLLQKEPTHIGFFGVLVLATLLIAGIDIFLWLVLGGWSPPAPALITILVLSVAIPIAFLHEWRTAKRGRIPAPMNEDKSTAPNPDAKIAS